MERLHVGIFNGLVKPVTLVQEKRKILNIGRLANGGYHLKNDNDYSELFKDVFYIILATHNEHFHLWEKLSKESVHHYRGFPMIEWKQVYQGQSVTIGKLDNRPIVLSIDYGYLNGKKILFYDAISQVVDLKMVDEWIEKHSNGIPHCDAANYHNCLNSIRA